ncbi:MULTISPECIES: peptide chain release factor domain protein [Neisseria]|nr:MULTISPECIES: peptide chain release factor domain protein [Neisseria]
MPSEPEKRSSDGIFACNSNADGQNQGASDAVIWCVQAREFGADARTPV